MARKPNRPAKGAAPAPDAPAFGQSLRDRLGQPPADDSLAAIDWMVRALAGLTAHVLESVEIPEDKKPAEILKIADRMAKLRDPDRMYLAEQALRGQKQQQEDSRPGPQMRDASVFDTASDPVPARRGRPSKRSLS